MDFEKWKGEFSVDAEGTTEEAEEGKQGLLSDFVDYVKVFLISRFLCLSVGDLLHSLDESFSWSHFSVSYILKLS